MKNSLLFVFVVLLAMLPGVNAMHQKTMSAEKMRELYLDFFDADVYNLSFFDTSAWGNRTWDPENHYYVYETGIRVEEDYPEASTTVTFPGFTPIRIESGWRDQRFAEAPTVSAASCSTSSASVYSMGSLDSSSDFSLAAPSEKKTNKVSEAEQWHAVIENDCGVFQRYQSCPGMLGMFDTSGWGDRHWDCDFCRWEYVNGVTVEYQIDPKITIITFPQYHPILIEGIWNDRRFSHNSQSSVLHPQRNLDALYEQFKTDHISDRPAWGNTRRYNDDLTAYVYTDTGIRVDQRLGVVFFPGHQAGLPFERPSNTIPKVMRTGQSGTQIILRDIIVFICIASLWYYLPSKLS